MRNSSCSTKVCGANSHILEIVIMTEAQRKTRNNTRVFALLFLWLVTWIIWNSPGKNKYIWNEVVLREKLQIHSLSSPSEAGGAALGMNLVRHVSTKTIRHNLNFYLCQMSEYTHTIYCQFCWFKRCSVSQS